VRDRPEAPRPLRFQHQADAERFLRAFQERLAKFGLEIQPEKMRLIAFGRFAAAFFIEAALD
jgi:hypothetical protein